MFSDKTGTLTQNVMEFRKFSVGGISYGRGVTDIGRAVAEGLGEEIPKEDLVSLFSRGRGAWVGRSNGLRGCLGTLRSSLKGNLQGSAHKRLQYFIQRYMFNVIEFFFCFRKNEATQPL